MINKLRENEAKPMGKMPTPPSEMAWNKMLIIMKKTIITTIITISTLTSTHAQTTIDWSSYALSGNSFSTTIDGVLFTLTQTPITAGATYNSFSLDTDALKIGQALTGQAASSKITLSFSAPVYNLQIPLWHVQNNPASIEESLDSFSIAPSSVILGTDWLWDGNQLTIDALASPNNTPSDAGVLKFAGPLSSISFNYLKSDNWPNSTIRVSNVTFNTSPVPEPSSTALLGLGALGLLARRKR